MRNRGIVVILLLLLNPSCGSDTYTVEYVHDVEIIHNHSPVWGETPQVRLEFIRRIGDVDGEDEQYLFAQPRQVEVDRDDNYYVLDRDLIRIQKYDHEWNYLMSIGNLGQGPGEFRDPLSFVIDRRSSLYVMDYLNNRIQMFDLSGNYLRTIMTEQRASFIAVTDTGNLLSWTAGNAAAPPDSTITLFTLFDEDGRYLRGFGEVIEYGRTAINWDANLCDLTVADDGYLYTSFYRQNRIEKYSLDGTLQFRTDRPVAFDLEPTEESITVPGTERVIEYLSFPNVSLSMDVDTEGRIWVSTFSREWDPRPADEVDRDIAPDLLHLDIFNSQGIWLGRVENPLYHSKFRIFGNRIIFIDSDVTACLYEYQIIESR
ncbi:NHL repeat-containing protein [Candidatus Zixiibacteriota bacterium]